MKKIDNVTQKFIKKDLPDIRPGDRVKVYQKIKEKDKERTQAFEGTVIARKHGKGIGATITVRKVVDGIGVERIFPLHLPTLKKIEIIRRSKVRRAKLYFLRNVSGKKAKLKRKKRKREARFDDEGSKGEEMQIPEQQPVPSQASQEPVSENKPEEITEEKSRQVPE